jgi:hypothetical protein
MKKVKRAKKATETRPRVALVHSKPTGPGPWALLFGELTVHRLCGAIGVFWVFKPLMDITFRETYLPIVNYWL